MRGPFLKSNLCEAKKNRILGGLRLLIPSFPSRAMAWKSWEASQRCPVTRGPGGCILVLRPASRLAHPSRLFILPGQEDGGLRAAVGPGPRLRASLGLHT